MRENDYQMACRYKEAIKHYEEMKLKMNELYDKVKNPTDPARRDSDAKDLAEMLLGMTEDEVGKNILSDLVGTRIAYYEKCIMSCEKEFEAL